MHRFQGSNSACQSCRCLFYLQQQQWRSGVCNFIYMSVLHSDWVTVHWILCWIFNIESHGIPSSLIGWHSNPMNGEAPIATVLTDELVMLENINQLKLKTSGKLPTILEDFREYTSNRTMSTGWTWKHQDLDQFDSCPKISSYTNSDRHSK